MRSDQVTAIPREERHVSRSQRERRRCGNDNGSLRRPFWKQRDYDSDKLRLSLCGRATILSGLWLWSRRWGSRTATTHLRATAAGFLFLDGSRARLQSKNSLRCHQQYTEKQGTDCFGKGHYDFFADLSAALTFFRYLAGSFLKSFWHDLQQSLISWPSWTKT